MQRPAHSTHARCTNQVIIIVKFLSSSLNWKYLIEVRLRKYYDMLINYHLTSYYHCQNFNYLCRGCVRQPFRGLPYPVISKKGKIYINTQANLIALYFNRAKLKELKLRVQKMENFKSNKKFISAEPISRE